jgi:hypothetical protein
MTDTATLADVEEKIREHEQAIANLRTIGARLAVDAGMSGQDMLDWLTDRGMGEHRARHLIANIVMERRDGVTR